MQQYNQIKARYPGTILLFRVGDFYETFSEDAIITSRVLGIVLTKRANGSASHIELAGFPHHSLDAYMPRLVKAGYRVAICDQLEDPKMTKTVVKRGVTEIVSPGVVLNDKLLDNRSNNYLAALFYEKEQAALALTDISTGEFMVAQADIARIEKLIQSYAPAEILCAKPQQSQVRGRLGNNVLLQALDEWFFTPDFGQSLLEEHFQTTSLKGFGIDTWPLAITAAGAALHYLRESRHPQLSHLNAISRIETDEFVWLDRFTIRNLELVQGAHEGGIPLLQILDKTASPMGARLLRKWLLFPLKNLAAIHHRLDLVEFLLHNAKTTEKFRNLLSQLPDIERLMAKLATARMNPREALQLRNGLALTADIKALCAESEHPAIQQLAEGIDPLSECLELLSKTLTDEPPLLTNKGGILRDGLLEELDHLRTIAYSGKDYLLKMQQKEVEATGISSLKVGFNNVFGYYLEVTNVHKDKVPPHWIRKQTLVNAERYITDELKQFEDQILGAEEKIFALEEEYFRNLILSLNNQVPALQVNAARLATLDCLVGFAILAKQNRYCKPLVNDSLELDIQQGRHPVLEKQLKEGEHYVPNTLLLNDHDQQIIMITGPNMSGKSAILRQTALIVLMAQCGSFVPAQAATIGWVDKIFTRVGANDNLSTGESTFMVEMNETASILNNLSERSLVLLDEIGRGTATYDGISIAWAIAEYLHNHPKYKARTLFATHYHELNEMERSYPRIRNFNVSVREMPDKIIFLRKLVAGGSHHSFGIHVARMAGVPEHVVAKARLILKDLEAQRSSGPKPKALKDQQQMNLFAHSGPDLSALKEKLQSIEIETLTPVDALFQLYELKKLLPDSSRK